MNARSFAVKLTSTAAIAACGLCLATGTARAQTTWINVDEATVLTGEWSTDEHWDSGVPPTAHAYLTNSIGSYVVDIDTEPVEFTHLTMRNSNGTITLNVNTNLAFGTGANALYLYVYAGGVLNVNKETTDIRWTVGMTGDIVVGTNATFKTYANNATSGGLDGGSLNVQSNGLWQSTGGLFIRPGTTVNIEPDGRWENSASIFIPRNTWDSTTIVITNRGTVYHSAAWGYMLLGSGGRADFYQESGTFTFLSQHSRLAIGVNTAQYGGTGRFFMNGGAADVWSTLILGGNSDFGFSGNDYKGRAISVKGTLRIGGGEWVHSGYPIQVGGWYTTDARMTGFADPAASYENIRGELIQTGGEFRTSGNIRVANCPSQGLIDISGGTFSVTNTSGTGTIELGTHVGIEALQEADPGIGTLTVSGGWARVDRLIATSVVAEVSHSIVNLHGGTLEIKQSVQTAAETDFTVGNGTDPVRLLLGDGSSSDFSGGLVINTNATLSVGGTNTIGSATLTGDVTVHQNARLAWNFDIDDQDSLAVTGVVDLPAAATLELTSLDGSTPNRIPLLTATGGFTGSNPSAWERVVVEDATYGVVIEDGTTLVAMLPRGTIFSIR